LRAQRFSVRSILKNKLLDASGQRGIVLSILI